MPEEIEAQDPDGQSLAEPERPAWLPDNFENPEAFRQSYDEQRAMISRQGADLAQTQELLQQLVEEVGQRPAREEPMGEDPLMARYQEALEEGDGRTLLAIHSFVAQEAAKQQWAEAQKAQSGPGLASASQNMFQQMVTQQARSIVGEDEWEQIRVDVGNELLQKPYLVPDTDDPTAAAEALVDVARLVQARKGTRQQPDNPEQGAVEGALRESGLDSTQQKRLAQTLVGQGVRVVQPQDDDATYWARVVSAPTGGWQG